MLLSDGDHIYAVIKGFAVNNDGSAKVGYTAPSVDGQAQGHRDGASRGRCAIPSRSRYIEAHGTATPLGDPIEFAALNRAFRAADQSQGLLCLGTAKMNVGHLDIAAGVTGLINAVQALGSRATAARHPFQAPNPNIDLANSPFYVNTQLSPWEARHHPRRAGVSAFGVGGTNAHVVLEEAPDVDRPRPASCRPSAGAVGPDRDGPRDRPPTNLAEHLKAHPEVDLDSVAFTLQAGRRCVRPSRAVVCADRDDAIRVLEDARPPSASSLRVHDGRDRHASSSCSLAKARNTVDMGAGLYRRGRPVPRRRRYLLRRS